MKYHPSALLILTAIVASTSGEGPPKALPRKKSSKRDASLQGVVSELTGEIEINNMDGNAKTSWPAPSPEPTYILPTVYPVVTPEPTYSKFDNFDLYTFRLI
jgi:hypothetical protein